MEPGWLDEDATGCAEVFFFRRTLVSVRGVASSTVASGVLDLGFLPDGFGPAVTAGLSLSLEDGVTRRWTTEAMTAR